MEATAAAERATSREPPQSRGECAIGAMTLWQHPESSRVQHCRRYGAVHRRLESPVFVLGQEALHLRVVFLGFQGTGAVHQETTGFHDGGGRPEDLALQRG